MRRRKAQKIMPGKMVRSVVPIPKNIDNEKIARYAVLSIRKKPDFLYKKSLYGQLKTLTIYLILNGM